MVRQLRTLADSESSLKRCQHNAVRVDVKSMQPSPASHSSETMSRAKPHGIRPQKLIQSHIEGSTVMSSVHRRAADFDGAPQNDER